MINALKTDRGLALQDLLTGAFEYIDTVEFPPAARVYLLDQLATTESVILLCSNPRRIAHILTDTGYQLGQMKDFS